MSFHGQSFEFGKGLSSCKTNNEYVYVIKVLSAWSME